MGTRNKVSDPAPLRILPSDVVAAIHHVQLNDAGWWERSVERLVLMSLWLHGEPLNVEGIAMRLATDLGIHVAHEDLDGACTRLRGRGDLYVATGQHVQLPEKVRRLVQDEASGLAARENRMRLRFDSLAKEHCATCPEHVPWTTFLSEVIIKLARSMGARMVHFLEAGPEDSLSTNAVVNGYLDAIPTDARDGAKKCVIQFFDPGNAEVRSFLLDYMTSFFCVEASQMNRDAVKQLFVDKGHTYNITLLLDTNFLMSVFDLHESEFNGVVAKLLDVVKHLPKNIVFKLAVLPITIDEFRSSLLANLAAAKRAQTSEGILIIAQEYVSGVLYKYLHTSGARGTIERADLYFRRYIDDTMALLKSKGVDIFNDNIVSMSDQSVIDDINSRMDFEKTRKGRIPRSYEQIRHDVMLWHAAQRRRPRRVDAPLNAEFFVATLDGSLLGFDSFKTATQTHSLPVCLNPAAILQLVQFWVPRGPALDAALVDSFRMPFFRQEFDKSAERVTLKILDTLSVFENIGEMSTETIREMVFNDALRSRITLVKDVDKEIALVKEALIEHNEKLQRRLNEAGQQLNDTNRKLGEMEQQVNAAVSVQERLATLEAEKKSRDEHESENQARRSFLVHWLGGALLCSLLLSGATWGVNRFVYGDLAWRVPLLVLGLTVSLGAFVIYRVGRTKPLVSTAWWFRLTKWLGSIVFVSFLQALFFKGATTVAWEWIAEWWKARP